MTGDLVTRAEAIEIAAIVARETIDNAARGDGGVRLPVPLTRLGLTQGSGPPGAVVSVLMDGDSEPIPVANASARYLNGTQRVLVHFPPPQGAYIIGVLDGDSMVDQVLIRGEQLATARSTIQIDNPSLDFDHLFLTVRAKSTGSDSGAGLRLNGHSGGADYRHQWLEYLSGGGAATFGDTDLDCVVVAPAPVSTSAEWGYGEVRIFDYATAERQTFLGHSRGLAGFVRSNTLTAGSTLFTPAAVTGITMFTNGGNFAVGTRYALYGVGRRTLRAGLP